MSSPLVHGTGRVEVTRLPGGRTEPDEVAVEEPLEIRVNGVAVAVTMRTPGHDEELALGFLLSEGLRPTGAEPPADLAANTIEATVEGFDPASLARNFYTTSSCGVCGKGALEAIAVEAPRVTSDLRVPAALVAALPARLRESQPTFAATGGLHATGLFDGSGELLCLREDVGRHNAMDKAIGWAFGALAPPARPARPLRQRPALLRARPEGRGGGLPDRRRRRRALLARRRSRPRPRRHPLRLRPGRAGQRLLGALAHRGVTGVLLVGGASRRFGSPKALAPPGGRDAGRTRARPARAHLRHRHRRRQGGRRPAAPLPGARRRQRDPRPDRRHRRRASCSRRTRSPSACPPTCPSSRAAPRRPGGGRARGRRRPPADRAAPRGLPTLDPAGARAAGRVGSARAPRGDPRAERRRRRR